MNAIKKNYVMGKIKEFKGSITTFIDINKLDKNEVWLFIQENM